MSFGGGPDLAFGAFRLSTRDRTLSGGAGQIRLPSRAFDVLVALVESEATVVTKADLRRRVWGDVIVEDNNLHVQIAAVRRALGADARFIQTVPGRGYRFVGELSRPPPSPAAAALTSTNLPTPMTEMIGRDAELARIVALLGTARLVSLVGPGGVGKTRLALAAAEAAPAGERWMLDLSEADSAEAVVAELGRALGGEGADALAAALAERRALLLIDGCEPHVDAAAALARRLLRRCPDARVLVTSQTPLGLDGEHVVRLAPFELPGEGDPIDPDQALVLDAVRLFAERAAMVDGRFRLGAADAAAVLQICRALDGVPLAIELAAARAPVLGLEPLRARIVDRLGLLGDRRDLPVRHRSLRAAVSWSYRLAGELEQRVLRRLAVFPADFDLAAAQEVAAGDGVSPEDVVAGLSALVQRSLVATGDDLIRPRHRLLQVVRDFVRQQPGWDDERPRLGGRHARYFAGLAEAADQGWTLGADEPGAACLDAELESLRAAIVWSFGAGGDAAVGVRLVAAAARCWFDAGLYAEAAVWFARALEAAPPRTDRALLMRLYHLGELAASAAEPPPPTTASLGSG